MIILKSIGGLGNQMFEIAYARYLSLEYNEKIYVDTSAYKKYKIRGFSLSNLYINDYFESGDKIPLNFFKRTYLKFSQKIYRVKQKLIKEFLHTDKIGNKLFDSYVKKGLHYNFDVYFYESSTTNREVKCLYGYFQSEKYFEKYKDRIKNELKVRKKPTLKERKLLNQILSEKAVGVSMRLGDDYKTSKILNVCTDEYYINGIQTILEKQPDATIYIFSDDIKRARTLINNKFEVNYVEGFKDYESLRLLYSCKHFIIANSSFSWWGAYLSEYNDKIIIVPERWYNNSQEKPDIYTDMMTTISL